MKTWWVCLALLALVSTISVTSAELERDLDADDDEALREEIVDAAERLTDRLDIERDDDESDSEEELNFLDDDDEVNDEDSASSADEDELDEDDAITASSHRDRNAWFWSRRRRRSPAKPIRKYVRKPAPKPIRKYIRKPAPKPIRKPEPPTFQTILRPIPLPLIHNPLNVRTVGKRDPHQPVAALNAHPVYVSLRRGRRRRLYRRRVYRRRVYRRRYRRRRSSRRRRTYG